MNKLNNIKKIRLEKKISQLELATKAGVSQPFIHDLERQARSAKPETFERIAAALGVPVNELFSDEKGDKTA